MKGKKAGVIAIVGSLAVWLTIGVVAFVLQNARMKECVETIRIFESVDEIILSPEITIKEPEIKTDAYLDGLEISESYCKELLYKGKKVFLYAYVFAEESDAQEYFQKYKGYTGELPPQINHTASFGIFSSDFIVCHGNCLYRLYSTDGSALVGVLKIIRSNFPIVIC